MKLNNIIDSNYKYEIIDEATFDTKYLLCNTDGSKYKKYLLVCYKDGDIVKYDDIPDEKYLDRFSNIIKTYNIEEIISTRNCFDGMYKELNYFHVDNLYFMKYLWDEDYKAPGEDDDDANADYKKVEAYFINKH